ncbi:hypothetical protein HYX00_01665 [Candidatus Woesearchaeota archaeon]|nr:hypothetical protein [Candidatus Woesearchaeota archaeon]
MILLTLFLMVFIVDVKPQGDGAKGGDGGDIQPPQFQPQPPSSPSCDIQLAGCYPSANIAPNQFNYYLTQDRCLSTPNGCVCSISTNPQEIRDADQSSLACGCFQNPAWDTNGKCCGDDESDCGRIAGNVLCNQGTDEAQTNWISAGRANANDIKYINCANKEFLSDGNNWYRCDGIFSRRIVSGNEFICTRKGQESFVECCGDNTQNCISKTNGKRITTGQSEIYLPGSFVDVEIALNKDRFNTGEKLSVSATLAGDNARRADLYLIALAPNGNFLPLLPSNQLGTTNQAAPFRTNFLVTRETLNNLWEYTFRGNELCGQWTIYGILTEPGTTLDTSNRNNWLSHQTKTFNLGITQPISQPTPQTYTKTTAGMGRNPTITCDTGDTRIRCQDTGNGRNHGCNPVGDNGCYAWEGSANYGAEGCLIECRRAQQTQQQTQQCINPTSSSATSSQTQTIVKDIQAVQSSQEENCASRFGAGWEKVLFNYRSKITFCKKMATVQLSSSGVSQRVLADIKSLINPPGGGPNADVDCANAFGEGYKDGGVDSDTHITFCKKIITVTYNPTSERYIAEAHGTWPHTNNCAAFGAGWQSYVYDSASDITWCKLYTTPQSTSSTTGSVIYPINKITGRVVISPSDSCPNPAGISEIETLSNPLKLQPDNPPKVILKINDKPVDTSTEGKIRDNPIRVIKGQPLVFAVSITDSQLQNLPMRYYVTQYQGGTWPRLSAHYGIGFGFAQAVGSSCTKTVIQTQDWAVDTYALHIVVGQSIDRAASSSLVFFQVVETQTTSPIGPSTTQSMSQTYYCTPDKKFVTELDTPEPNRGDTALNNKNRATCEAAGFKWTGTKCCSEDDDNLSTTTLREFYNDAGGNGGCWNSTYVRSVDFVNGTKNSTINYNGEFHGCAIDRRNFNAENDNLLALRDKHSGAQLITNHDYCFNDPEGNYYCSYSERWLPTEGTERIRLSTAPVSTTTTSGTTASGTSNSITRIDSPLLGSATYTSSNKNPLEPFIRMNGLFRGNAADPVIVQQGQAIRLEIGINRNINPPYPIRIYLTKKRSNENAWDRVNGAYGDGIGFIQAGQVFELTLQPAQTNTLSAGLYSLYVVIGNSLPQLSSSEELFFEVRGTSATSSAPAIPTLTSAIPSTFPSECCAQEQCWNGSSCISNQRNNPQAQTINGQRCIDGNWMQQTLRSTPDGSRTGYCPRETQCLIDPSATTEASQCIESGNYLSTGDNYCENGNWSSRTKLLALKLLKMKSGDFTLFCDNRQNTLNNLQYLSESGEIVENVLTNLQTNNFCVLKNNNRVIAATSINRNLEDIPRNALNILGVTNCNNALIDDNQYHSCDSTNKVWFNKRQKSFIYSSTSITVPSEDNPLVSLEEFITNPIRTIIDTIIRLITTPPFDESYVNAIKKFDRLYMTQQGSKSVRGAIEGTNFKNAVIGYTNFENNICNFIQQFNQGRSDVSSGISCRNEGNNYYVLAQGSQLTNLNPESIWPDLTSKLRLT